MKRDNETGQRGGGEPIADHDPLEEAAEAMTNPQEAFPEPNAPPSPYRLIRDSSLDRVGVGCYDYQIFEGERLIARYWHHYREEQQGIDFIGGRSEVWASRDRFEFTGPGGQLSKRAVAYIDRILKKKKRDERAL